MTIKSMLERKERLQNDLDDLLIQEEMLRIRKESLLAGLKLVDSLTEDETADCYIVNGQLVNLQETK
jgi:hypothetical protein